jgi:glycogen synthase
MSEKRILIASLLKPINDTRMYEKLGLSISKLANTEIHICGFEGKIPEIQNSNLCFHSLFSFDRLSISRFRAQLKYYRFLKNLKPDLVVVCTHELLLASYIYCKKHNIKLVYDIQENYTLNLQKQNNYNSVLKRLLAFGVGSIEKFTASAVSQFILAEKSYSEELTFIEDRYTILENKYKKPENHLTPPTPVTLSDDRLRLLYSGTISEEYGIKEAITLVDKLVKFHKPASLTIIGYCANKETLEQTQQLISGKEYIKLIGGDKLVQHSEIINEIAKADFGLLPYQPNDSTARCMPTKLYEYMANALPVLISPNPLWQAIVQQRQAGISINFENINVAELWYLINNTPFYTLGIPEDIFWDDEEAKLLQIIGELL